jgi:pimeloyl-ACP methyl ester carboxylesterase
MKTDNSLTLPDGRKLAYAEFGQPDGYPVLFFHGNLSSRLEPLMIGDEVFRQNGLRIIAPDRPGMGQSDFRSRWEFSDWPKDVEFLADALGLEKFSVLGNSGGGGYVAACAARIPQRLRAAVIVSGGWRMDWPEARKHVKFPASLNWSLAIHAPFLLPLMLKVSLAMPTDERGREKMQAQQKRVLAAADAVVLAQDDRVEAFINMINEAMVQGVKGSVWDIRLYVRDWDFRLNEIQMPLKLFYGELDTNIPMVVVRRAMRDLPTAELITYLDEGHFSTFINHFDDIAKALVGE